MRQLDIRTRSGVAASIVLTFLALFTGSVSAATTYTWTGGHGTTPWYHADNWDGGVVPSQGSSKITSPIATAADDVAIFDSETATGGYMPTDNVDMPRVSASYYPPNIEVRNGTVIFNRADNYGYGSTFTVGDGDLTTAATFNMAATINMNRDGSSVKTYVVNADGTLVLGENITTWSSQDAVVQLLGGVVSCSGTIVGLTGDTGDYVSFEAAGSSFTAAFGVGTDFVNIGNVTDNIGDGLSFRATEGFYLEAVDNGGTFTINCFADSPSITLDDALEGYVVTNASLGTLVGTLAMANTNGTFAYALETSDDYAYFDIPEVGSTNKLRTAKWIDSGSYSISIIGTESGGGGLVVTNDFTITVTDAVSDDWVFVVSADVQSGAADGTVIGTAQTLQSGATFSISGGRDDLFYFDGADLKLTNSASWGSLGTTNYVTLQAAGGSVTNELIVAASVVSGATSGTIFKFR